MDNDTDTISRLICKIFKALYFKGLITPLAGNASVRIDDKIVITPSGKIKYDLKPSDLAIVTLNGEHVSGPKPSSEVYMHLAVYRSCNWCKALVHIHGILTPFLDENLVKELLLDTELEYVLKPNICFVEKLRPGSLELAKAVASKIAKGCNIVILKYHGVVSVGRSLEEAVELAEAIELASLRTIMMKMLFFALHK